MDGHWHTQTYDEKEANAATTEHTSLLEKGKQSKVGIWCRKHKLIAGGVAMLVLLLPLLGLLALRHGRVRAEFVSRMYPQRRAKETLGG